MVNICFSPDPQVIKEFVQEHLQDRVSEFEFDFRQRTVGGESLRSALVPLQQEGITPITAISFNLYDTRIDDVALKILAEELAKIKWAETSKLDMCMNCNYLENEGIQCLVNNLLQIPAQSSIETTNNPGLTPLLVQNLEETTNLTVEGDNLIIGNNHNIIMEIDNYIIEMYHQSQ